MRLRLPLAALAAVFAAFAVTAATATAAQPTGTISAPITAAQSAGALNGVFQITKFTTDAGQLVANGTFTGTYTDPVTGLTRTITSDASSVVTNAAGAGGGCQVLDLVLGPLHLDLLGLNVDLNQVHLNITAQPGPGNLLGNLLCSVSHLLDNTGGGGQSGAIQNLLNILNGLLGGL